MHKADGLYPPLCSVKNRVYPIGLHGMPCSPTGHAVLGYRVYPIGLHTIPLRTAGERLSFLWDNIIKISASGYRKKHSNERQARGRHKIQEGLTRFVMTFL